MDEEELLNLFKGVLSQQIKIESVGSEITNSVIRQIVETQHLDEKGVLTTLTSLRAGYASCGHHVRSSAELGGVCMTCGVRVLCKACAETNICANCGRVVCKHCQIRSIFTNEIYCPSCRREVWIKRILGIR